MATRVALEDFAKTLGGFIELSSVALGASIVCCSDEFFAPASDLLKVAPAVSMKGQFGPSGALFDGWETRRHNPAFDWVIIRLGAVGTLAGFDVDTANFNGNEGPAASVHGLFLPDGAPTVDDPEWETLVPQSPLGPSSRHLFSLATESKPMTHLKLCMYPDGGIARFRAYGTVIPAQAVPGQETAALDLAYVLNGGRVVAVSDQHFGVGNNLVLPGRGKSMGDGWETKRSRGGEHNDWAIIKLGSPGILQWTEIDTIHFMGNFPASCELLATSSSEVIPSASAEWKPILPRSKLGPHKQHFFQLDEYPGADPVTHVKLVIHPDGGIKRVRLIGRRYLPGAASNEPIPNPDPVEKSLPSVPTTTSASAPAATTGSAVPQIPALPLSSSAFSAYGSVIQTFARSTPALPNEDDDRTLIASTREGGVSIKTVNFGTAKKYNHLAPCRFIRPPSSSASLTPELNCCIFRCDRQTSPLPVNSASGESLWPVEALERHEFSTQSFVPMGSWSAGSRYLVIVAMPGSDGQPDFKTLRAFTAISSQGIAYHPNIWHHPLIALDDGQNSQEKMEFYCTVYETGIPKIDCELLEWDSAKSIVVVQ